MRLSNEISRIAKSIYHYKNFSWWDAPIALINYQINLARSDRTSKVSCVTFLWLLHIVISHQLHQLPTPTKFSVFWQDSHGVTSSSRCCSSLNSAGEFFWGNAIHTWTQRLVQEVPKTFHPARGSQVGNPKLWSLKFQSYCRVSDTTRPILGPLPSQICINDCIPLFMNALYTLKVEFFSAYRTLFYQKLNYLFFKNTAKKLAFSHRWNNYSLKVEQFFNI